MSEITIDMIKRAYQVAKQAHKKEIRHSDGVQTLIDECNMEKSSAAGYIYVYKAMRKGHRYTRTINTMAIEYYLTRIFIDAGIEALRKAVTAVSEHTDYYEDIKETYMNGNRAIIRKFNRLIENNFHEVEKFINEISLE
jgi:hypothetical protein